MSRSTITFQVLVATVAPKIKDTVVVVEGIPTSTYTVRENLLKFQWFIVHLR